MEVVAAGSAVIGERAYAAHSFTNPGSGNDPSKGAAYNKEADERSWKAMKSFFEEIFCVS